MSVAVAHLEAFRGPFTIADLDDFPEIGGDESIHVDWPAALDVRPSDLVAT